VQEAVPGVIAWADPPVVAINAPSKLRWATIGGTIVRVIGLLTVPSGYKDQSVSTAFLSVTPSDDGPSFSGPVVSPSSHTYTVELLSEPGDQMQGSPQSVTVYLHQAVIAQFGFQIESGDVEPTVTVPFGQLVTLAWTCPFVDPQQGVTLSYNQTSFQALPVFAATVDPSQGLVPNGTRVSFALTAPGYYLSAGAAVTLTFEPIIILYFKFSMLTSTGGTDTLSNMVAATEPATVQGMVITAVPNTTDLWSLTVTGPGGPFIRYLGLGSEAYVEVRYFSPTSPVASGTPFTLQWLTHNAATLTLTTPDGLVSIDAANIAKGTSQPFSLTSAFTFILSAETPGQPPVSSYLTVTPS
jgi:hypothetical protein